MIGRRTRATAAALAALAALTIGAPTTLADASFDPSAQGEIIETGSVNVLPVVLAILVGLAIVLLLRTRSPQGALKLIGTLGSLAFGGLFIAAGFLGDFSGQHRIFPIPILLGIGLIAMVAIGVWRGRRARRLAPPPSPVEEHRVA